jgi:hypothetical protein
VEIPMFFKKSKAIKSALAAANPLISNFKQFHEIPKGFWGDPYVLGFLNSVITFHAKGATNGNLSATDMGTVSMKVYESLSGISGEEIGRKVAGYLSDGNIDYCLGFENGMKCVLIVHGKANAELLNDPDVLKAQAMAKDLKQGSVTSSALVGALIYTLFCEVVEERLIGSIDKYAQKEGAVVSKESVKDLLLKDLKKRGVEVSIFTPECLNEFAEECIRAANVGSLIYDDYHTELLKTVDFQGLVIEGELFIYKGGVQEDSDTFANSILKKHGVFQKYKNKLGEEGYLAQGVDSDKNDVFVKREITNDLKIELLERSIDARLFSDECLSDIYSFLYKAVSQSNDIYSHESGSDDFDYELNYYIKNTFELIANHMNKKKLMDEDNFIYGILKKHGVVKDQPEKQTVCNPSMPDKKEILTDYLKFYALQVMVHDEYPFEKLVEQNDFKIVLKEVIKGNYQLLEFKEIKHDQDGNGTFIWSNPSSLPQSPAYVCPDKGLSYSSEDIAETLKEFINNREGDEDKLIGFQALSYLYKLKE